MIRTLPLLLLLTALIYSSCQKDDHALGTSLNRAEAAKQFLANTPSLILFGSLLMHHETGTVTGWVIDKDAQLRSVEVNDLENLLALSPANALESSKLYRHSSVVKEIDQLALAENYKVALLQTPNNETSARDMTQGQTSVIISFQPISSTYSPALNDCNNAMVAVAGHMNGFQYNRKVWSANGRINQVTNLDKGLEIVQWMNDLVAAAEEN